MFKWIIKGNIFPIPFSPRIRHCLFRCHFLHINKSHFSFYFFSFFFFVIVTKCAYVVTCQGFGFLIFESFDGSENGLLCLFQKWKCFCFKIYCVFLRGKSFLNIYGEIWGVPNIVCVGGKKGPCKAFNNIYIKRICFSYFLRSEVNFEN